MPGNKADLRAARSGETMLEPAVSRHTAARSRPLIQVDGPCKPSAVNKELEEADNEIQRLNELSLGDDISYEEYYGYLKQLPVETDVDTSTKLDALQLKELNTRHALYRIKYYRYQVRSVACHPELYIIIFFCILRMLPVLVWYTLL
jgi:hypothetical protein